MNERFLVDITWYGLSSFRISDRGQISVITDPFSDEIGIPAPKYKGEIVTVSHDKPGHNNVDAVKGVTYVLRGPGEYEVGGVFINGIAMPYVGEDGVQSNVAYLIEYGDMNILHLGDLRHVPEQSMIESLGQVHVVLIPVGGGNTLKAAEASEVVALIEPNYIVPMHYMLPGLTVLLDPVDKFLKEMGVSKVQEEDILKITASGLPEQPQVVVLRPQSQ
jgi:L-ascorbate metabolism protein UlaG (beta-lactamase superfamily)